MLTFGLLRDMYTTFLDENQVFDPSIHPIHLPMWTLYITSLDIFSI